MIPMKPGFVSACSVDFGTGIDDEVWNFPIEFDDFHSFSVTQSTDGLSERFHCRDWVALPDDLAFDEVALHSGRWCCCSSRPDACNMLRVGVGRDSLLHESLHILEVARHSLFESLLLVPDIDLVRHFTSDLVNDDRNSADSSILTLSGASWVSAVAVSDFKVHQFHSFGQFF